MDRLIALEKIETAFRTGRVVAILGPRQSGKTTVARKYFNEHDGKKENYFDLENPRDLIRLQDPMLALEHLSGLIVIDEIQRVPELFSVLRVLVDEDNLTYKKQFLVLGSASRELISQSSESLAGRIRYIELMPFSVTEIGKIDNKNMDRLWVRGGFPLAYLAKTEQDSDEWRMDYIRTFLEQDIPNLGISIPPANLRRFWTMLASYHGQLFNASEIGNALSLSSHTTQRYCDLLTSTFMIRQLNPWHENISKRQVKSKKIYFRDSGIFHSLLGIPDLASLRLNPKIAASWEGFALESIIRYLKVDSHDCYFWRTHSQAELDLLVVRGSKRIGFEFKYSAAPSTTKSMHSALNDLALDKIWVIYPGNILIKLTEKIHCVGLNILEAGSFEF